MTHYCYWPSPLGEMLLTVADSALTGLYFVEQDKVPAAIAGGEHAPTLPLFAEACTQLTEYFAGSRREFTLPIAPQGTLFQRRVWTALLEIPYSHTTSYGALAQGLGRPSASRAVGAANGQNPIGIVVPCHRVIGANGALTGYAGGLWRKQALLELEQGRGFELRP